MTSPSSRCAAVGAAMPSFVPVPDRDRHRRRYEMCLSCRHAQSPQRLRACPRARDQLLRIVVMGHGEEPPEQAAGPRAEPGVRAEPGLPGAPGVPGTPGVRAEPGSAPPPDAPERWPLGTPLTSPVPQTPGISPPAPAPPTDSGLEAMLRSGGAGRRPGRPTLVVVAAVGIFVAAALTVSFLMFAHLAHIGRSADSTHAASPRASRPTPSPARTPPAAPAAAVFPALAGVGCAVLPGTDAATSTSSAVGDGWINVGGGWPECGGKALATRKTGTADIFVAATDPSSGLATYEVFGDSLTPGARLGRFVVNQAAAKGQWVPEGSWQVRNVLRITLTDAPGYP